MLVGIIQFILIVIIVIYEYKKKSPAFFLWITLTILFGIPHMFTTLEVENMLELSILNEASFFVILFCIFYIFTRLLLSKVFNLQIIIRTISKNKSKKFLKIVEKLFYLSFILYLVSIFKVNGISFNINKTLIYKTMASKNLLTLISTYLYYASSPIILYYLRIKNNKKMIIIGMLIVFRTLITTSRMDMMILIVAIISNIILQNKIKIKDIIKISIIGITSIYIIYFIRAFRYYYSLTSIFSIDFMLLNNQIISFIMEGNGDINLREVFYFFIRGDNKFEGFGNLSTYKRLLLFFIPNKLIFNIKPEDMCLTMGRAWRPDFNGIIEYSVTPTLFGDCYANLGFNGFILGILWAIIITIFDRIIIKVKKNEIKLILYSLIAVNYIDIARGSIYNPICLIWYCLIILIFIQLIQRIKIKYIK